MYLFIFEDGSIRRKDIVQDGDLMEADDGVLDIIDIRKSDEPKMYYEGKWNEIEEWL